ncbi:MAG: GCN5-related N-acetyltransferase [Gemmatimonadetes bacterium]|nr:GCN5-related N-acetyltransferase [Gemmatimonadota bacterium]
MERIEDDAQPDAGRMVFHAVDRTRWADVERLFEGRGGPKSCWCMVWRATPAEARDTSGRARKAALHGRVEGGVPIGILGYVDGEPLAWCSVAPRDTYRRLDGAEAKEEDGERVWSIACFFIHRALRGQGAMNRLLAAAVEHARDQRATVVEAYPVDADSPSYRFMGFVPSFEAAGFREVGRAGTRRHVMRLALR